LTTAATVSRPDDPHADLLTAAAVDPNTSALWAEAAPQGLRATLRIPGDKSISHRAVMLGAIARGTTEVNGFLEGADALSTMHAFRALGVSIEGPNKGHLRIAGVGLHGLQAASAPLDCGNAGTAMRLMMGLLAGQRFSSTLVGDASLSKRPMRRVAEPLGRMGAQVGTRDGRPPIQISPGSGLHGIDFALPVASAQVKSAVLLAGLYAQGTTRVTEPSPTRDHTERMLGGFGVQVLLEGASRTVSGGQSLEACAIEVPGDISSAAFFLVAASIIPGSDLTLEHVGINPTRTGVIAILRRMGATIELLNPREAGGEPVADLRVRAASLQGIEVPRELVALAIDEFPVLFVAACCARGTTVVRGAEELRVKESDRIAAMEAGLLACGATVKATPDGMIIQGDPEQRFAGVQIDSRGDHRIAMAFTVAAQRATAPVEILDTANVATSFPNFVALAQACGMQVVARVKGPTAAPTAAPTAGPTAAPTTAPNAAQRGASAGTVH
jgi:3-phosphoshikimate 1-carboxyvinyltransferase